MTASSSWSLREVQLDALAGRGVQEATAVGSSEWFTEQDPPPGMEPAVESAVGARFRGTLTPWAAHGTEAEIVGDVICKDALGDQSCRPIA